MAHNEAFKVKSNISIRKYGKSLNKSYLQEIYDLLFFPIRCTLPYRWVQGLKLTDLGRERRRAVIPYLNGRILDVGCGPLGELKDEYTYGKDIISTDIFQWGSVDLSCSAEALPFKDNTFDTVLMLACLNHFDNKDFAVKEAYRVLKPRGRIVLTMIGQTTGYLVHGAAFWFDYDHYRKRSKAETGGLSQSFIMRLLRNNYFRNLKIKPFLYGLNNLFIGEK